MSNAFEFTNFAEVKELRQTSYGNSLVETVSLALQKKGSISEIQKMLEDLLFKLNEDQKNADDAWDKERARLTKIIEDLAEDIKKLNKSIADNEEERLKYEKLIKKAKKNLKQYNAQVLKNKDSIKKTNENRDKDEKEFKQSESAHNAVITAIDAVVEELEKLIGSVSGVGKPEHVKEIKEETRDREYQESQSKPQPENRTAPAENTSTPAENTSTPAENTSTPAENTSTPAENTSTPAETTSTPAETSNTPAETSNTPAETSNTPAETSNTPPNSSTSGTSFSQLYQSFLQVTKDEEEANLFVQMATSADQAALKKLIALLKKLKASTIHSYNDDVTHNNNSIETAKQLIKTLNSDNKKLGGMIEEQGKNLKHYVKEEARLAGLIKKEKELRKSKKKLKKDTEKEREDKKAQYEADKKERESEGRVIKRLQKIVNERLANMSKYLRSQTGGF